MGWLAFVLPLVSGYCALRAVLPDDLQPRWAGQCLAAALGALAGIGVVSCLFFLIAAAGFASPGTVMGANLLLLALAGALLRFRRGGSPALQPAAPGPAAFRWNWLLVIALAAAFALLLAGLIDVSRSMRYGEWDAWNIWNLRAKFLSGLSGPWKGLETSPYTGHGDYPLLVPGFIAQVWTALGATPQWVPAAAGLLFFCATEALLVAALALARAVSSALLAGLVLLASTSFLYQAVMQYADVPLAAYYLAALSLLLLDSRTSLVLAGTFASLAAWTKNEGLLFCAVLLIALLALRTRVYGLRAALSASGAFLLGAVPALVLTLCFKLFLAPSSDPVLHQTAASLLQKAVDGGRWVRILSAAARETWLLGESWWHPLLLVAVLALTLRFRIDPHTYAAWRTVGLTVTLVAAGYFAVYLFTTQDLAWQLQTSLSRLYAQLWPSFVLLSFLAISPPEWRRDLRG